MKVKDAQFFTVVSSFLNVYLVKNRSCSSNTVKSYEDLVYPWGTPGGGLQI